MAKDLASDLGLIPEELHESVERADQAREWASGRRALASTQWGDLWARQFDDYKGTGLDIPGAEGIQAAWEFATVPKGPLVEVGRASAGIRQMEAENQWILNRREELVDRWRRMPRGEREAPEDIREYEALGELLKFMRQGDLSGYRERSSETGWWELGTSLGQGVIAAGIAPGLGAGVVRNVAAGLVDPGGQVLATGLGVAGKAARALHESEAGALRLPKREDFPPQAVAAGAAIGVGGAAVAMAVRAALKRRAARMAGEVGEAADAGLGRVGQVMPEAPPVTALPEEPLAAVSPPPPPVQPGPGAALGPGAPPPAPPPAAAPSAITPPSAPPWMAVGRGAGVRISPTGVFNGLPDDTLQYIQNSNEYYYTFAKQEISNPRTVQAAFDKMGLADDLARKVMAEPDGSLAEQVTRLRAAMLQAEWEYQQALAIQQMGHQAGDFEFETAAHQMATLGLRNLEFRLAASQKLGTELGRGLQALKIALGYRGVRNSAQSAIQANRIMNEMAGKIKKSNGQVDEELLAEWNQIKAWFDANESRIAGWEEIGLLGTKLPEPPPGPLAGGAESPAKKAARQAQESAAFEARMEKGVKTPGGRGAIQGAISTVLGRGKGVARGAPETAVPPPLGSVDPGAAKELKALRKDLWNLQRQSEAARGEGRVDEALQIEARGQQTLSRIDEIIEDQEIARYVTAQQLPKTVEATEDVLAQRATAGTISRRRAKIRENVAGHQPEKWVGEVQNKLTRQLNRAMDRDEQKAQVFLARTSVAIEKELEKTLGKAWRQEVGTHVERLVGKLKVGTPDEVDYAMAETAIDEMVRRRPDLAKFADTFKKLIQRAEDRRAADIEREVRRSEAVSDRLTVKARVEVARLGDAIEAALEKTLGKAWQQEVGEHVKNLTEKLRYGMPDEIDYAMAETAIYEMLKRRPDLAKPAARFRELIQKAEARQAFDIVREVRGSEAVSARLTARERIERIDRFMKAGGDPRRAREAIDDLRQGGLEARKVAAEYERDLAKQRSMGMVGSEEWEKLSRTRKDELMATLASPEFWDNPRAARAFAAAMSNPTNWERAHLMRLASMMSSFGTLTMNLMGGLGETGTAPFLRVGAGLAERVAPVERGFKGTIFEELPAEGGGVIRTVKSQFEEPSHRNATERMALDEIAGWQASFRTALEKARITLETGISDRPIREMGAYGADVVTREAPAMFGAATGGALGWGQTPEGASPQERARNVALGALGGGVLGAGAGTNIPRLGVSPLNLVFRHMAAGDDFVRNLNESGAIMAEARRESLRTGKNMNAILLDLPNYPQVMERASGHIEARTYTQELGKTSRLVQGIRKHNAWVQAMIPFWQTIANIASVGWQRTPILPGLVKGRWDVFGEKELARQGKYAEAADRRAQGMIGSVVLGAAALGAVTDNVTAYGPSDPTEREMWLAQGNKPYSIRIGDQWYGYTSWGAAIVPIAIAATAVEAYREATRKGDYDTQERVTRVLVGAARSFGSLWLNVMALKGVSDVMSAIQDPKRYGPALVNSLFISYVPMGSFLASIARAFDPEVKDPDDFFQALAARMPGLSQGVAPRLTPLGEEVERGHAGPLAFLPLQATQVRPSPVIQEYQRLRETGQDVAIGRVGQSIGKVKLTSKEQHEYDKLAGQLTKRILERAIANPAYRQMDAKLQAKFLQDMRDVAREMARSTVTGRGGKDFLRRQIMAEMGIAGGRP